MKSSFLTIVAAAFVNFSVTIAGSDVADFPENSVVFPKPKQSPQLANLKKNDIEAIKNNRVLVSLPALKLLEDKCNANVSPSIWGGLHVELESAVNFRLADALEELGLVKEIWILGGVSCKFLDSLADDFKNEIEEIEIRNPEAKVLPKIASFKNLKVFRYFGDGRGDLDELPVLPMCIRLDLGGEPLTEKAIQTILVMPQLREFTAKNTGNVPATLLSKLKASRTWKCYDVGD